MKARELAAWSAANTLADAVRVAIERLDGPASVRDPDQALDILQTALGIANAAIEVVHDRVASGPLVDTSAATGTPMKGASS